MLRFEEGEFALKLFTPSVKAREFSLYFFDAVACQRFILQAVSQIDSSLALPDNLEDAEFAAFVGIPDVGTYDHIDVHAEFVKHSDEPV